MADCDKYQDLISAFADGELSDREQSQIQKHLEECPTCQALLSAYRSISEAAQESMEEPPEDFTGLVMGRIKALPDSGEGQPARRSWKSYRPAIISFVAAAACLALAFIVSPQLFNFTNTTGSAPMAQAKTAAPAEPEDGSNGLMYSTAPDQAGSAESYGVQTAPGDASDSQDGRSTTKSVPEASPAPAPGIAPSVAKGTLKGARADTANLETYYAVITVNGQLPDILQGAKETDNGDGSFNIEITPQAAEQLISDGYTAVRGNQNAAAALVVHTPA